MDLVYRIKLNKEKEKLEKLGQNLHKNKKEKEKDLEKLQNNKDN